MKFLLFLCVITVLTVHQTINASFTYGQPCSERNTAYLYVTTWRLPNQKEVNCVDISGFKKSLSTSFNLSHYNLFFERVARADTIYADHMGLKRFPILVIYALPNTETIDMSANEISKLPPNIYKIAPKLTKLLFSENKIIIPKRKPLMASPTLKTLMLSDNSINYLSKFTFAKLPALEVLYLDSNRLKFIHPKMFDPMKNLKYLHLGKNFLAHIPPKSVMPTSIQQYITKSQRPLKRRSVERKTTRKHRKQKFISNKLPQ
ncbi:carboxypeptidase N subunit 2 [Anoplophora glabripennis]|uniref:Leucine-rich repeat-containing G-protein coupled receptor 4 n=1 Tax=Anoplophora glabripennis TaxID=217634 RepID=V5GRY2_ANOGL|nr:carboxypeptidase N subunit 2 [Anoplophora glabripennis]